MSAQCASNIHTTCAYCGVGCGITAEVVDVDTRQVKIKGQSDHPANFGRLCSKGTALAETLGAENRLLHPLVDGQQVSWESALDQVAQRFMAVIDEHGPDAVAFYLSGQLLTEDYYVANKLMKGFIGTANVDTNSRLCMSSSVVGHKRAFGTDTVPGNYEDLEQADLVILTGSNTAWCHPIVFQRIKAAKKLRPEMKVVVIDPRRTATCEIADLYLPVKPGTDAFLFNGLLSYLSRLGSIDYEYLERHTEGFGSAIKAANETAGDIVTVALKCGLKEAEVATLFDWFRRTEKSVSVYSQGINQSSSGSDKVNAIINCHLATGRIGKPGMGPFSLTGQPNAMGGREVGGLANQLAAHMDFEPEDIERVSRFWNAPNIAQKAGLKAVDLFEAVAEGRIKAVWIMGTNPAVSLPNANRVAQALSRCATVIVSDCIHHTDTAEYANILLPALGWGEKDGTVTNSERRISRQRALLPPMGEARPDWWALCEVGRRMGYKEGFNFQSSHEIFIEHAALSGFENSPDDRLRDFNIAALSDISPQQYDQLQPFQWPLYKQETTGTSRLFADGQYFTSNRKARLLPIIPSLPKGELSEEYPLSLNTGRIRDQWHTMTRTGLAPQLNQHIAEPFCEIHPDDAAAINVEQDSLIRISSSYGKMLARAQITDTQQPGQLFVPMHWTGQLSSAGRMGPLINPVTDPFSGQPESKHTPVKAEAFAANWHGFVFSRKPLEVEGIAYWVKIRGRQFYRYELAGDAAIENFSHWSRKLLLSGVPHEEWQEYSDPSAGKYRAAAFVDGKLTGCLFIAPDSQLPERSWLASMFDAENLTDKDRLSLLAGIPMNQAANTGKTVCACFGVGENTIRNTIQQQQLNSVEAIGKCLNAGTNCGSCIPELQALLDAQ
ncbi:nitrate reductase [Hahella sp. CCB-MM4]|uniref:nitrate reductase n=1 Tax=Hahella sp. (strain CCB-MM4) TaxID=1926491 RepID=UPI000B9A908C|nr:nitrate reductase [Hahella sp. CCB-MM4]OZG71941.1 nitrate reductase [Hahella sp. CCB-MM4]